MAPRAKAAPKAAPTASEQSIVIPSIKIITMDIPVTGLSSLIVNQWSEKAKQMMRDKQTKAPKQAREAKNPEADFLGSKYLNDDEEDCVPTSAFKRAIVDAASFADGVTKVLLRGAFFVGAGLELLPVKFSECRMREDMVRIAGQTADIRYRAEYLDWSVDLPVSYNANVISDAQIVNLINLAGFSVGVCEWRPQCNGQHGRFEVKM